MTRFNLYYCPRFPLASVITARSPAMPEMFGIVNNYVDAYHAGKLDQTNLEAYSMVGPNLVQANLIARDLRNNPIAKPFLLNKRFVIETGDTRYLALTMHPHITHVDCLMSTNEDPPPGWTLVRNKQALARLLNINEEDILMHTPTWHDSSLSWIEFHMPTTETLRLDLNLCRMRMDRYLQSRPRGWRITQDWLLEDVDWSNFEN